MKSFTDLSYTSYSNQLNDQEGSLDTKMEYSTFTDSNLSFETSSIKSSALGQHCVLAQAVQQIQKLQTNHAKVVQKYSKHVAIQQMTHKLLIKTLTRYHQFFMKIKHIQQVKRLKSSQYNKTKSFLETFKICELPQQENQQFFNEQIKQSRGTNNRYNEQTSVRKPIQPLSRSINNRQIDIISIPSMNKIYKVSSKCFESHLVFSICKQENISSKLESLPPDSILIAEEQEQQKNCRIISGNKDKKLFKLDIPRLSLRQQQFKPSQSPIMKAQTSRNFNEKQKQRVMQNFREHFQKQYKQEQQQNSLTIKKQKSFFTTKNACTPKKKPNLSTPRSKNS